VANYGTIALADAYFALRLETDVWDNAVVADRTAALTMATAAIERLNFAGEVETLGQEFQFPRTDDTEIPQDILDATYLCALALLDGVDLELEQEMTGVTSDAYSGVRTTYDSYSRQDHIKAGIPSYEAWMILLPYLRDPQEVILRRVS
jgi:hypothetical protein